MHDIKQKIREKEIMEADMESDMEVEQVKKRKQLDEVDAFFTT